MNKLLIMIISLIIGTQVCIGAEKEGKRPNLRVDIGDQTPTMVPVHAEGESRHIPHATPHHVPDKRFFVASKPAAPTRVGLGTKSKSTKVKLELPKVPAADKEVVKAKQNSLTPLLKNLEDIDAEVARAVAGETSPTTIAKEVRERAGSFAMLAAQVGVPEQESRKKAADFLKTLEECHKKHMQRASDKQ